MNAREDAKDAMKKLSPTDPETHSADILEGNIEQLKTLFPEAFTEGKVDFDVLKQLLGGAVDEREEKYGLNWHGKRGSSRSPPPPARYARARKTASTGTPRRT
jgi:hypothetical protein